MSGAEFGGVVRGRQQKEHLAPSSNLHSTAVKRGVREGKSNTNSHTKNNNSSSNSSNNLSSTSRNHCRVASPVPGLVSPETVSLTATPGALNHFIEVTAAPLPSSHLLDLDERSRGNKSVSQRKRSAAATAKRTSPGRSQSLADLGDKLDSFLERSRQSSARHGGGMLDERSRGDQSRGAKSMSSLYRESSRANRTGRSSGNNGAAGTGGGIRSTTGHDSSTMLRRSSGGRERERDLGSHSRHRSRSHHRSRSRHRSKSTSRGIDRTSSSNSDKLEAYFDETPKRKPGSRETRSVFTSATKYRSVRKKEKLYEPPKNEGVEAELLSFLAALPTTKEAAAIKKKKSRSSRDNDSTPSSPDDPFSSPQLVDSKSSLEDVQESAKSRRQLLERAGSKPRLTRQHKSSRETTSLKSPKPSRRSSQPNDASSTTPKSVHGKSKSNDYDHALTPRSRNHPHHNHHRPPRTPELAEKKVSPGSMRGRQISPADGERRRAYSRRPEPKERDGGRDSNHSVSSAKQGRRSSSLPPAPIISPKSRYALLLKGNSPEDVDRIAKQQQEEAARSSRAKSPRRRSSAGRNGALDAVNEETRGKRDPAFDAEMQKSKSSLRKKPSGRASDHRDTNEAPPSPRRSSTGHDEKYTKTPRSSRRMGEEQISRSSRRLTAEEPYGKDSIDRSQRDRLRKTQSSRAQLSEDSTGDKHRQKSSRRPSFESKSMPSRPKDRERSRGSIPASPRTGQRQSSRSISGKEDGRSVKSMSALSATRKRASGSGATSRSSILKDSALRRRSAEHQVSDSHAMALTERRRSSQPGTHNDETEPQTQVGSKSRSMQRNSSGNGGDKTSSSLSSTNQEPTAVLRMPSLEGSQAKLMADEVRNREKRGVLRSSSGDQKAAEPSHIVEQASSGPSDFVEGKFMDKSAGQHASGEASNRKVSSTAMDSETWQSRGEKSSQGVPSIEKIDNKQEKSDMPSLSSTLPPSCSMSSSGMTEQPKREKGQGETDSSTSSSSSSSSSSDSSSSTSSGSAGEKESFEAAPTLNKVSCVNHDTAVTMPACSTRESGMPLQSIDVDPAAHEAQKETKEEEPQYDQEDIFTWYSWSHSRQDLRKIQKERMILRNSILDTPLYRAYERLRAIQ